MLIVCIGDEDCVEYVSGVSSRDHSLGRVPFVCVEGGVETDEGVITASKKERSIRIRFDGVDTTTMTSKILGNVKILSNLFDVVMRFLLMMVMSIMMMMMRGR